MTIIDKAVVISLPQREDRLKEFLSGLPKPWPFPQIEVVPGVVAQAPASWRASSGAYGCALAHISVIESAFRTGVRGLLVLEDDAVFSENFPQQWRSFAQAVPPSWSMLMLGGQHVEEPQRLGRISRCFNTRRTHAYVIRDRAMPLVARTWRSASSHIDHLLPYLEARMKVFAPSPFLVGQRGGLSDISGEWREERFWHELPVS